MMIEKASSYPSMAISGKYYMYYGRDFMPPRELGRENARRMLKELMLDNLGFCRFHRAWAETLLPDIVENLFGEKEAFLRSISLTASRITSRNASVFWESERNMDMVFEFLKNKKQIDKTEHPELDRWVEFFTRDKSMLLPTNSGTRYTRGPMSCCGNTLCDENLFAKHGCLVLDNNEVTHVETIGC